MKSKVSYEAQKNTKKLDCFFKGEEKEDEKDD